MESRQLARELIQKHERFRAKMYKDSLGIETIGWGFNLRDRAMPKWLLDTLLEEDINMAESDLDRLIPWWRNLDPVRQAALWDMSYNMGYTRLSKFKLGSLELIRQGRYKEAANQLRKSLWHRQTKTRAIRITKAIETGQWIT